MLCKFYIVSLEETSTLNKSGFQIGLNLSVKPEKEQSVNIPKVFIQARRYVQRFQNYHKINKWYIGR